MADNKNQKLSGDEEILRVAKERYKLAEELWSDIYAEAEKDLKFLSGDQWDEIDKRNRKLENRPCLTINKLPHHLNQVVNDQRQNRPSIKVSPVDDGADIETAKAIQGLIKHIQNDSNADAARDRAFEGAAGNGIGFYRILSEYVSPYSFDQKLKISRVPDYSQVKIDPFSKEPDGSDMKWGFVESDYSKDDYCTEYPETKLAKTNDWTSFATESQGWVSEKSVRVTEYYSIDLEEITIAQVRIEQLDELGQLKQSIQVVDHSKLPEDFPEANILNTRKAMVPKVMHYKLNGVEILGRTVFPGKWVPILPVYGKELIIKGKRILEGLIRHSRDPQRMYNYMTTSEAELIGLAPKAPFIAAAGQISKEEMPNWKSANTKTHAVLFYEPKANNGQLMPPPQRNVYDVPTAAITSSRMQASDDLKTTTGIYDAALGARSNEVSGTAIRGRQAQAQTSNYHFFDNLTRTIKHEGRILVGAIPVVYDAERAERIIGEEGDEQIVTLNAIFNKKNGDQAFYDLSAGEYDVHVDTGPSFATKRQEAATSMLDFMKVVPQHAPMVADLVAKNMDWNGASEFADRLKKLLPPGIAEEKDQKKSEIPPEAQAQMEQMGQMIEQLTAKANEQAEAIKMKKVELESRERIEFAKLENATVLKQMDIQGAAANQLFAAELSRLGQRLDLLDMSQPIDADDQYQNQNPNYQEFPNLEESGFTQEAAIQEEQQQQPQPTDGFSSSGQFIEE